MQAVKLLREQNFAAARRAGSSLICTLVLGLISIAFISASAAAEPPWEKPVPAGSVDTYPETREGIDAYKEHLIRKQHEEISDYPQEVTHISTLKELSHYAGKNGVHVRMKPGVYSIGVDNYEDVWKGKKGDSYSRRRVDLEGRNIKYETGQILLSFSGDNSYYDLRGVTIRIDTYLNHTLPFFADVGCTSYNTILEGLTVRMIGNYAPGPGGYLTFEQMGNNNLFKGLKIVSRGSKGYGFYDSRITTLAGGRSALRVGGQNNVYVDVDVYQRATGHVLFWKSRAVRTFIDCHVEGELRLSDDIVEEKPTGAFYSLPPGIKAKDILRDDVSAPAPGRMVRLVQGGYRSYEGLHTRHIKRTPSELKVLGGAIKNVRRIFYRGASTNEFISNVNISGVPDGGPYVATQSHVEHYKIVNSEVDLGCQNLLRFSDSGGTTGFEADITVLPNPFEFRPFVRGRADESGDIAPGGSHHKVVLRAGEGLDPEQVKEERKDQPFLVSGEHHYVRNETGLPIVLTEQSRNCRVISNGEVTDNGENNEIEYIDGKHLFILSGQSNMYHLDPDISFTPTVAEEFGEDNVIVVKDAQGGRPIRQWYKQWKSIEGDQPEKTGELYDRLMKKVGKAIKGENIKTVTFVWMQGERDAKKEWGEVYKSSLKGLFNQLRKDLGRDDINFVIGRLSDFDMDNSKYPHWTMVRQAQVEVANSEPLAAWVNTDDLNDGKNLKGEIVKNDLHYSEKGYRTNKKDSGRFSAR